MKIVRLAIFLTGIMGLTIGGLTTISSLRSGQEEAVLKTNENLKSQAVLLVDQFFGTLEAVRSLPANANSYPSYITHRGTLKMVQGLPEKWVNFAGTEENDLAYEERVFQAIKRNLSAQDLQLFKVSLGTFDLADRGNKAGIFIATPIYKTVNGVSDPSIIDQVSVSLIDPVKAFGGLQKLADSEQSAYLIDRRGRVLAHTVSAFVGIDLAKSAQLKETVENLFLGAQTGVVSKYTAVDGAREQVAFVRAGTYPFAFGVEQRAIPPVMSGAWMSSMFDSGAARKNLGFALIMIAIALGGFAAISLFASKHLRKEMEERGSRRDEKSAEPILQEETAFPKLTSRVAPSLMAAEKESAAVARSLEKSSALTDPDAKKPETPIAPSAFDPSQLDLAASAFVESRAQLQVEKAISRDVAREFAQRIEKSRTLEGIEKDLVSVASQLSESPVLYFRYHRRNQNLTLAAVAGEIKIPNYQAMQAYVRKDIEAQVEKLADEGKVASVSNYGPVSKLIMSQLNIAHFEAWAVTSHPEVSQQSKLMGILVVLQAGTKSAQARPILAKILKDSGNYLFAQAGKIRPRAKGVNAERPVPGESAQT